MRTFGVNLSQLPAAHAEKAAVFRNLSGGLNLWELDYRMDADQSPEMKNLWWRDGVLGCRDGQEYIWDQPLGKGLCCFDDLFWGHWIAHIGDGLYAARPGEAPVQLCSGLPEIRGTFLRYQESLLYKTKGAYKQLRWDNGLTAEDVLPYTPVTVINCAPDGSGDLYQPENRLSPRKIVWYHPAQDLYTASFSTTADIKRYTITAEVPVAAVQQVYLDGQLLAETDYSLSEDLLTVTLTIAPRSRQQLDVVCAVNVLTYQLPVQEVDQIVEVTVDGEAVEFTADCQAGTVTLTEASGIPDPSASNTIHITYEKANPEAEQSILDCRYGGVYGGTGGAVVVLAGSEQQPNAYFWNGSHLRMDPGYFPMEHYNLAGDDLEPVTGFGRQAGYLVVLKQRSLGRCLLGTTEISGRVRLTLDYTPINHAIGCDLPWTIRTVGNHLVWCSTHGGVFLLRETTAALENVVECISRNIAGCDSRPGLLADAAAAETVCSLDDGERYWICTGDHAYVWDHVLSDWRKPSWFFFTNIPAVGFFRGDDPASLTDTDAPFTGVRRVYHLDQQGRVSRFLRNFRDYDGPIEKIYQFAAQNFGSYERRKDIRRILITTRSDTDSVLHLRYDTDHEKRWDKTPIRSYGWRLSPRNLVRRYLASNPFAHVAVRTPGCRGVRHFSLRLENREAGCDMSVVGAEVHFVFTGRER